MDEQNIEDERARAGAEEYPDANQTHAQENVFTSREVADTLGVVTSSLRRYSIALEAEGYHIIRNLRDRRVYTESNVISLRKLKELTNSGVSVENAAKVICGSERKSKDKVKNNEITPTAVPEELIKQIEQLKNHFVKQEEDRKVTNQKLDLVAKELSDMKEINRKLIEKLEAKEEAESVNKIDEVPRKKKWWQR